MTKIDETMKATIEYGPKGSFRWNWDKMPPLDTKIAEVDNEPHYWTVVGEGIAGMIECESTAPKQLGYQCVMPSQMGRKLDHVFDEHGWEIHEPPLIMAYQFGGDERDHRDHPWEPTVIEDIDLDLTMAPLKEGEALMSFDFKKDRIMRGGLIVVKDGKVTRSYITCET